jgi:hypothetical protein
MDTSYRPLLKAAGLVLVAAVLVVLGTPFVVVGLLALFLDAVLWPVVVGLSALVAAAAAAFVAYRQLVSWQKAPAERPPLRSVFISYNTVEHHVLAHELRDWLIREGYDAIVFGLSEHGSSTDDRTARGMCALHQILDLDAELIEGLLKAQACIYLTPVTERKLSFWAKAQDTFDNLVTLIGFRYGRNHIAILAALQGMLYGKHIRPAFRFLDKESWQEWELRMAEELELPVFRIGSKLPDDTKAGVQPGPPALALDATTYAWLDRFLHTAKPPGRKIQAVVPEMVVGLIGSLAAYASAAVSLVTVVLFLVVRVLV